MSGHLNKVTHLNHHGPTFQHKTKASDSRSNLYLGCCIWDLRILAKLGPWGLWCWEWKWGKKCVDSFSVTKPQCDWTFLFLLFLFKFSCLQVVFSTSHCLTYAATFRIGHKMFLGFDVPFLESISPASTFIAQMICGLLSLANG